MLHFEIIVSHVLAISKSSQSQVYALQVLLKPFDWSISIVFSTQIKIYAMISKITQLPSRKNQNPITYNYLITNGECCQLLKHLNLKQSTSSS